MRVEFAYAQARAQARGSAIPDAATWRVLESSRTLAQYLHASRATVLAPLVSHFTADSAPHAIERSLRRGWRRTVSAAASWVPTEWQPAVGWTARLPDIAVFDYLSGGGETRPWIHDDRYLDAAVAGIDVDGGANDALDSWIRQWHALWPAAKPKEMAALAELAALLGSYRGRRLGATLAAGQIMELGMRLQQQCLALLRRRRQQPASVFAYLAIMAVGLWRLRAGLLRRAAFPAPGEGVQ